jgi:GT2 family glycosyltransferase
MTRREVLRAVDTWDESYFMYFEEIDLCYRIKRLGLETWFLPKWNIIHYGGASSKTSEFSLLSEYKGIKSFYKKFYPSWQYPILRLLLKIGALGRIMLFGILEGRESAKIYAKAFRIA